MKVKRLNFTNQTEIIKVPFLDPDTVMQYLINAGLTIPQEHVVEFWEKNGALEKHGSRTAQRPTNTFPLPFTVMHVVFTLPERIRSTWGYSFLYPYGDPAQLDTVVGAFFRLKLKNFMECKPCIRFCKGLHTN